MSPVRRESTKRLINPPVKHAADTSVRITEHAIATLNHFGPSSTRCSGRRWRATWPIRRAASANGLVEHDHRADQLEAEHRHEPGEAVEQQRGAAVVGPQQGDREAAQPVRLARRQLDLLERLAEPDRPLPVPQHREQVLRDARSGERRRHDVGDRRDAAVRDRLGDLRRDPRGRRSSPAAARPRPGGARAARSATGRRRCASRRRRCRARAATPSRNDASSASLEPRHLRPAASSASQTSSARSPPPTSSTRRVSATRGTLLRSAQQDFEPYALQAISTSL